MHAMHTMKTIVGGGLLLALGATAVAQDLPENVNRRVREATGIDLNAVVAAGGMPVHDDGTIDRLDPANQPRLLGSRFLDLETIMPATGDVVGAVGTVVADRMGPQGRELRLAVDFDALDRLDPAQASHRITLPVFDGETLELILLHPEAHGADRWSWVGKIAGIAVSDVILVRGHDAVHLIARDYASDRGFDLRWASPTEHVLRAVATGPDPGTRCSTGAAPGATLTPDAGAASGRTASGGAAAVGTTSDPGNVVDVMYVATNQAAAAIGSEGNFILLCINSAIDFNMRCANNGLDLGVRIAAVYFNSGYDESSSGGYGFSADGFVDLQRIVDMGDPYLEWVHPARDDVAADLVVLLRSSAWATSDSFNSAGVTWAPDTLAEMESGHPWDSDDGGFAFVVSTITGNYTRHVSHELGHTFGACHNDGADPEGGSCGTTITTSPKGYVDICEDLVNWNCSMTTMAYSPDICTAGYYPPAWSSPSYFWDPNLFCPEVAMGDFESNVANLLNVSKFTRAQSRIGAVIRYVATSSAAPTAADGTYFSPFTAVEVGVSDVQGGVDEGVVRVAPGTYDEATPTSPLLLSNPCTVEAYNGTVLIK